MSGFETILPILQGVGTAVSVIGAIQGAGAASDAASYNAKVAENNAIAARQQAAANAEAQSRAARQRIGQMEANYGASGISMEGSALDILEQSARDAELDRLNIIYGGEVRARGYGAEADLQSSKANDTSGYWSAGGALLSGMAKAGQLTQNPVSDMAQYGGTTNYEYIDSSTVI